MRGFTILLIAATFAAGANAQPNVDEKPRFGITPNYDLYPQNTPKAALETATKLLEAKRFDYFLAHLVEPAILQAKLQDRAARLEPEVEQALLLKRDEQKRNPERVETRDRLPVEPKAFQAAVRDEAFARSFKLVVKDLQTHLLDYPENIKSFRRFFSEGQIADAGATATITHKDFAGKTIFLKSDGKRWTLEDKQADEPKPTTEK